MCEINMLCILPDGHKGIHKTKASKELIKAMGKCDRCEKNTPEIYGKCINQEWYSGKPDCFHDKKLNQ